MVRGHRCLKRKLTLVAGETVVEILGRRLVPLRVGSLLTAAVSAGAGRALGLVSHGLSAVASRRLRLGTRVAGLLSRTVRTCIWQSVSSVWSGKKGEGAGGSKHTTVLVEVSRRGAGVAGRLRALRAVLLVRVERLSLARRLVLAPLRRISIQTSDRWGHRIDETSDR